MPGKSYSCRCGLKPMPAPRTRLLQHFGYGHSEEHSALFCADIERWPKLQGMRDPTASTRLKKHHTYKPVPMLFMRLDR